MKASIWLGYAAMFAGCLGIYLGSPNQRWLARSWSARPARLGAVTLLIAGWFCLAQAMQWLTASFVFLSFVMLAFCVLTYLGAWLGAQRGR